MGYVVRGFLIGGYEVKVFEKGEGRDNRSVNWGSHRVGQRVAGREEEEVYASMYAFGKGWQTGR